jgi:3-phosphoshikimate 1-carboxyvinyltransferase
VSGSINIQPSSLSGSVSSPPSKSYAHRAVIAAALAHGRSCVTNLDLSQDIEATKGAVSALGAKVELKDNPDGRKEALIVGISEKAAMPLLDCRESGSTLRFLLPVALAVCGGAVFTGSGRLGQRPLGPILGIFRQQGIHVKQGDCGFPLTVRGELKPGKFTVPGNVSSQFITGLMLAAPLLNGESEIQVEGSLESIDYVHITMDVLQSFGVDVREEAVGKRYIVAGGQQYRPTEYAVEGDWSQAAFLLLEGLLGGQVSVGGLRRQSRQGDRVIEDVFRAMGGDLRWVDGTLISSRSGLRGITANVSQCPDLAPAIAAAMAVAQGESRITGGRRLREKESDRIMSIAACLSALGADITETEDGMIIHGKARLSGGAASSAGDHRIAMMAAAASPLCEGPIYLKGHEAVAKSWPGFWESFRGLGGALHEQPVG